MVKDRLVSTGKLHVINLALAGVFEHPELVRVIIVALLFAAFASEQEDRFGLRGRADTALFTSAVWPMDVRAAIVYLANFEGY